MSEIDEYFIKQLQPKPLIAILRGLSPDESVALANEAWALNVPLVEVTLQDESGYKALEAVAAAAPEGFDVGAGTITSASQIQPALDAGARFGIAPGFDAATVERAHHQEMPFLPGVATASEVQAAQDLGVRAVKAFPANVLTPSWIHAMKSPFPQVTFIATGGINGGNAREFLEAGARGMAISLLPGSTRLEQVSASLKI